MSARATKRVNLSPDTNDGPKILLKDELARRSPPGNRYRVDGIQCFRLPKSSKFSSASRLLRRLEAKVARALQFASIRRRSSRKVSSASSLARSRSLADSIDSHRAEAIEDCIEFLNLHRSNSVSTNS